MIPLKQKKEFKPKPKIIMPVMGKIHPPRDYGLQYDSVNNPEFLRKRNLLREGTNPYTNRQITIGGTASIKASKRLKEEYGIGGNENIDISGQTRDEYVEKKTKGYEKD